MSAGTPYGGLFDALPGSPAVDRLIDDGAFVAAVLEFEVALAAAQAKHGVIPAGAAAAIGAAAAAYEADLPALGVSAALTGNPVVAVVRELGSGAGGAARWVHYGVTSQDAIDTAFSLVTQRVLRHVRTELDTTILALAAIARKYVATPMTGRTLGRPAAPTTFGLVACGWVDGLRQAHAAISWNSAEELRVQCGGAVGTYGATGTPERPVVEDLARALGLHSAPLPWHTERGHLLRTASAITQLVNAAGKVAADVLDLSQPEIGEITLGRDPGQADRGGSSAMPQKHNPVSAILIAAAARQTPGLLSSVAAAGVHHYQRAVGDWQAEWRPLRELLHLCGGVSAELALLGRDLAPDPAAMRRNLTATGGAVRAETVMLLLAEHLGRTDAHALLRAATATALAEDRALAEVLVAEPRVAAVVSEADVRDALDPGKGSAAGAGLARTYLDTMEAQDHARR